MRAKEVSPHIILTHAIESYRTGAGILTSLDGKSTTVRVMELHLTAEQGRWAFIVDTSTGPPWLRINLDADENQVAEPVPPGE